MSTTTIASSPAIPPAASESSVFSLLYIRAVKDSTPVETRLAQFGLPVTAVDDPAEAVRLLRKRSFLLAVIHLVDERGSVPVIRALRAQNPHIPLAGLMDPSRPIAAAEAVRAGITDLLTWPLDERELGTLIANARDRAAVHLTQAAAGASGQPVLFANSPAMRVAMERVRAASQDSSGVLIFGEHATGRELVARTIHARSSRAARPFVVVDCSEGSLHELESRLFGMVTDRRSSAGHERPTSERVGVTGAVCRANGGTLFLRNVMEAPTRVQAKLARLLRDREAGLAEDRQLIDLDFRAIAAVDAGVDAAMAEERIRRDLYERLAQTRIDMPPFRRRREDLPLIATTFLRDVATRRGTTPKTCSRAAFVMLSALPWPANGKEMRALLETLVDASPRPVIQLDDLFDHIKLDSLAARVEAGGTLRDAKARFERDWISAVLMKHHGRVGEAAKALGIQRTNLYRKVRQLKVARTLLGPRRPTL